MVKAKQSFFGGKKSILWAATSQQRLHQSNQPVNQLYPEIFMEAKGTGANITYLIKNPRL